LLVLAAAGAGDATDDYAIPGTESQEAVDLFKAHSPAFGGVDSTLVFTVDDGKVSDPEPKAAIEGALTKVSDLDGVALVADPFEPGGQVSADGRLAAVDVRYSLSEGEITKEDGEALIAAGETAEPEVQVEARGILVDLAAEQDAPIGELVGVLIAIVLLTLLFRSGAAMTATLIGALTGVAAGQILLAAVSAPLGLPTFTTVLAAMLGLGAGIDYALLIIGRYREQRAAGDSLQDAAARAAATSGTTVVAAGLIVMVALAGLLVVGVPFIGKMGLGSALAVGAVVVAALTILPIMMGAFGRRLVPKKAEHAQVSPALTRWGEFITRRPWAAIVAGVAVLLIFAFPVTGMRIGQPDDGNQPESATQRVAYDQLSEAFGPGTSGPFLLAVDTPKNAPQTEAQLTALQKAVAAMPGVASVPAATLSEDGEMATIFAIPATAAGRPDLRSARPPTRRRHPAGDRKHTAQGVRGRQQRRVRRHLRQGLQPTPGLHRDGDRPVGAAAGRRVPLAVDPARLGALQPAVGRCRIRRRRRGLPRRLRREPDRRRLGRSDHLVPAGHALRDPVRAEHGLQRLPALANPREVQRGHNPRDSVIHGIGRIGKVVVFAALIMAGVFLSFVTGDDLIGKMFGVGLGLAILIDVLIVRMVISPAVVTRLGDRAWWLPAWLDRLLPNISLEGPRESGDVPPSLEELEPKPVTVAV
jgi:RND superfamily putative drug exporter